MKKILSFAALLLAFASLSWAYDFSAVAPTGQTLYYNISGSTVSVTSPETAWSDPYSGYTKPTGALTIPSMVTYNSQTYSVTSISDHAFFECSGLTSVTIPNSVTSIGFEAFYLVKNLVYNGTASGSPWGALCVNGYIEGDLIYTDSSKTHLAGCATTATSVTIPNSVTSIGDYAFCRCFGLTSVTIPNSVTSIGDYAFCRCSGLTSVTIPNSVTSIGNYTFNYCSGLTSVTIPNSLDSIGVCAFFRCTGLTSVTIPNSVTWIGYNAFYLVRNLVYNGMISGSPWGALCVNGYIEGDLVYTDSSKTNLVGCATAATSVTIPNSVTDLGKYAFFECLNLTTATIPNSVTSIGNYTFNYCSGLTSITIGNSVTSIGERAFYVCSALTEITSLASVAPLLGRDAFDSVSTTIPVNIPCGSSASYLSRWSYFSNFVESAGFSFSATTADSTQGVVQVLTEPSCTNPTAVIYAAANTGYHFNRWSDGNNENPRTIVLTSDTAIVGYFVPDDSPEGTAETADMAGIVIRTNGTRIMVEGIADETVRLFDCMGRCLLTVRATTNCTLQAPAPGVYMLQVSDHPAQRVVVLR